MEGAADTLLHHFRQQSKEFGFRCEAGLHPEAMGCIGRVFRSGEVRCNPCLNNAQQDSGTSTHAKHTPGQRTGVN